MAETLEQLELNFDILEEEIINPLKGVELSGIEGFVASLLLEASGEKPLKMADIIEAVRVGRQEKISERQVKIIINSLRNDHELPILSRRSQPAGYWWCGSEDEMKEFESMWFSQIRNELNTLRKMKKHYRRLAGQMTLPKESLLS